jgi:hypothetical protein
MNGPRPFGDVVDELMGSLGVGGLPREMLRVTALSVDVPIEFTVRRGPDDLVFLADLPRQRWRCDFDPLLGRMVLHASEGLPR